MIFPDKLRKGDLVKVVATSGSGDFPLLGKGTLEIVQRRFSSLGLSISYGKHFLEGKGYDSAEISSRVEDLHAAFIDPEVKMIVTAMGGYNANELLPHLDFELIRQNPKILCGYSDNTALLNGITTKTGLATYHGFNIFDFGEKKDFEYSLRYFKRCLFEDDSYVVRAPRQWAMDRWNENQDERHQIDNEGFYALQGGNGAGEIAGGNLFTFIQQLGTEYAPSLEGKLLFLEEHRSRDYLEFGKSLTFLSQAKGFGGVVGIVLGRFHPESRLPRERIEEIIGRNCNLKGIPIIGNVDIAHTTPKLMYPIGGTSRIDVEDYKASIEILRH